ncbi:cupin domain protein [Lophiotrema nucula]|uniref:Cupin domain protein n=1 Tax=Lophiotrema nucula TaxID=690887 RepID=A0A6A5Z602_9PLEO|nr:cupin domain protein [Lophiotrema nucula]
MEDVPSNLPALKRFITTHDDTGKAVFSSKLCEDTPFLEIPGAAFGLGYTTKSFPADLNGDKDIAAYETALEKPPGIVILDGSVLRFVDVGPGHFSPMHRTVSLDYGVVIEGDVSCVLDSGEERKMKRGDVTIQRGTMHAWRNNSKTEWARIMFVLQGCKPVTVNGEELKEDLADMHGVPASS